jgi:hypothetical protein
VELSDFDNWARVVEWALPLYAVAETNLPPELQKLINHWQRTAGSGDEKARLALQFVQDDLRYTGLELGPDSYRPTHPFETFEKRFGDCKGKVALLCTIYRAMNLEAYPALVNTYVREGIVRRLPSPFAFNHVIVKLNLAGRTIWLDPTISHQGGPLSNRSVPPLGKALVIQPGVAGLENIPPMLQDGPLQRVLSTFRITDYNSPVPLTVRTTYRGSAADSMREDLARSDARQLQKTYLNFYARYYSGIQGERPLDVSDDRARNVLTVTEHYVITNLWKLEEARHKWVAAFYGEALMDMLTDPATRLRRRPLWISFPLHREQEVVVQLPEKGWDIPAKTDGVTHAAFSFRYRRDYSGSTVRFRYECETKASEIPAEQVASYLTKRAEMENLLGDTLERPDDSRPILARINWLMVVVAGFGLCAALIGSVWIWRSTSIPLELPPVLPEERRYSGLGGWLFLIGLGLCLGPFTRLVSMARHWEGFFSIDAWQAVAMPSGDQYHPVYAPLLIFEVLGNSLLLGLNVLALCLYFGKRRIFPKTFIALMITNAVVLGIDALLGGMIPQVAATSDASSRREFFRACMAAMIWTAYMLKSKRVRATFREKQAAVNLPPIQSALP